MVEPQKKDRRIIGVEAALVTIVTILVALGDRQGTRVAVGMPVCWLFGSWIAYQLSEDLLHSIRRGWRIILCLGGSAVFFGSISYVLIPPAHEPQMRMELAALIPPINDLPLRARFFMIDVLPQTITVHSDGGAIKLTDQMLDHNELDGLVATAKANAVKMPAAHNEIAPGAENISFDVENHEISIEDLRNWLTAKTYIYVLVVADYQDEDTPSNKHGVTEICKYFRESWTIAQNCDVHNNHYMESGKLH